jgi:hypothetical protein
MLTEQNPALTAAEVRAAFLQAWLLALVAACGLYLLLQRQLHVLAPAALAIAFTLAPLLHYPYLRVRARERGRALPFARWMAACAASGAACVPLWYLADLFSR